MFSKLTIRARLIFMFTVIIILMVVISQEGIVRLKKLNTAQDHAISNYLPRLKLIGEMQRLQMDIKANEYALLIEKYDFDTGENKIKLISESLNELSEAINRIQATKQSAEDKMLWDSYTKAYKDWLGKNQEFMEIVNKKTSLLVDDVNYADPKIVLLNKMSTDYFNDDLMKAFIPVDSLLKDYSQLQINDAQNDSSATDKAANTSIIVILIVLGASIVIAIVLSVAFSGNINKMIKGLLEQTHKVVDDVLDGKLHSRPDPEETNFELREITEGISTLMDTIIRTITVMTDKVLSLAKGDIPEIVTKETHGDVTEMKEAINGLIVNTSEIVEKSKLIAKGDLTVKFKKRSENDELIESLSAMVDSVAKVVADFQSAAHNISNSSQEMSSTAQEISQGATEQASSTEEISSSMEEMTANIQQNTENAQETQKIAVNAAEGIKKVAESAKKTLTNVEEIANKVSIIGEIARETNILALNAAVEAARAGEHGKGFAVVAAEVRKLAERSQVSAVEIDELTKSSVKITRDAGEFMEAMVPEVEKTARLVQEIAAASVEQNSGTEQVNGAIQQLNQVTQQNASASEEVATSSEELASQSEQLLENVMFFKLPEEYEVKIKDVAGKQVYNTNKSQAVKYEKGKDREQGCNLNMAKEDVLDNEYEKF